MSDLVDQYWNIRSDSGVNHHGAVSQLARQVGVDRSTIERTLRRGGLEDERTIQRRAHKEARRQRRQATRQGEAT